MSSPPPSPSPSRPAGLTSPADSPAPQADTSYDHQLESHLNSPTEPNAINGPSNGDSDSEEDEFVYTGVDSAGPDPASGEGEPSSGQPSRTYNDQLAAFLDSDDEPDKTEVVENGTRGEVDAVGQLGRPVSDSLGPPRSGPNSTAPSGWHKSRLSQGQRLNWIARKLGTPALMLTALLNSRSHRRPRHSRHRRPQSAPLANPRPSHPPTQTQLSQPCHPTGHRISHPISHAHPHSDRSHPSPAGRRRSTPRSHACARLGITG